MRKAVDDRDHAMNFIPNGQGALVKNLEGKASYLSFRPTPLQQIPDLNFSLSGIRLLAECSRAVGEVAGMMRYVPNSDMYLAMYVRKEALLSSQIEGTQCTLDDILDPENEGATNKDVADVIRYVDAVEFAIKRLRELPLCTRLFRETHERLLAGIRGQEKSPGEIRSSQNWIGPAGCTLNTAYYVPPNVDDMNTALADLERYLNTDDETDPIVRAALAHYQFETIHPFLDGNGRLGRLLITLSLVNDGVFSGAAFYPSYELKARRGEYYDRLTAVRERGDYIGWVQFFCECLLSSALDAISSMRALVELHANSEATIRGQFERASNHGLSLLTVLEENPIVDVSIVSKRLGVSRTTASNLVNKFVGLGILQPQSTKQRYRKFVYEKYLAILRSGSGPLR